MRIGILTQPLQWNYGGIIQNWALQQMLRSMGHEPETICRQWDYPEPTFGLKIRRCFSFGKCLVRRLILRDKSVGVMNPFGRMYSPKALWWLENPYADTSFVNEKIQKTVPFHSDAEMRRAIEHNNYDAFIVGSDQVWREEYSPRIQSYFLDFLSESDKRKRIAYAASFGKERDYISPENMSECRRLLGRFDAVSVREAEGVDIVRRDFGREQVEKVLDPTLLLSVDDYNNIICPCDRHTSPYIASYILDNNDDKSAILSQLAADKGIPVNKVDIELRAGKMATMSQWLANFADADFVVTDSFHGCVFSIIFGKPFIVIANVERGLGRFISLLGELSLSDRMIYCYDDYIAHEPRLLTDIDYTSVRERLDTLRQKSLKYLSDALS